jgi:predicted DNA-binding protein
MHRTSILLDPGLLAELQRLARREGRPTSEVIRDALDAYVAGRRDTERALPGFVGIARGSGGGDIAERAEEILATELPARPEGDQPETAT